MKVGFFFSKFSVKIFDLWLDVFLRHRKIAYCILLFFNLALSLMLFKGQVALLSCLGIHVKSTRDFLVQWDEIIFKDFERLHVGCILSTKTFDIWNWLLRCIPHELVDWMVAVRININHLASSFSLLLHEFVNFVGRMGGTLKVFR